MDERAHHIYYAGFNGHLKLGPGSLGARVRGLHFFEPLLQNDISDKIDTFTEVKFPGQSVSYLTTAWSATLLRCENHFWHAGHTSGRPDPGLLAIPFPDVMATDSIRHVLLDPIAGLAGALTKDGRLFTRSDDGEAGAFVESLSLPDDCGPFIVDGCAISGSGHLYIASRDKDEATSGSRLDVVLWTKNGLGGHLRRLNCPEMIKTVAAGSTAVTILSVHGRVFTTGSPLQSALLARTLNAEHPADDLGPVDALGGIEIVKVCMCEWLAGALSADRDLYIWGGRAGEKLRIEALSEAEEDVSLVDIADGVDIADFAIGMGHILVLTTDGEVWGCGDNDYGQLGIEDANATFVRSWTRVTGSWSPHKPRQIEAGGYGSWIVAQSTGEKSPSIPISQSTPESFIST